MIKKNPGQTGKKRQETGDKRGKGRGGVPTPIGKRFSKDYQPDPKKQSVTKALKKVNRQMVEQILAGKYNFALGSQIRDQLITAFGPDVVKKSLFEIIQLQQVQRAILKSDTRAAEFLTSLIIPRKHEITGEGGQPLTSQPFTDNQVDKLIDALRSNKK